MTAHAMIGVLLAHPEFKHVFKKDDSESIPEKIAVVVKEVETIAPVCCFLGDKQMNEVYLMAMPIQGNG